MKKEKVFTREENHFEMQYDDVQLYLVFFCGLLLLLKQKLCPRMETPATYSIKSSATSSLTSLSQQQHKVEQHDNKKNSFEKLGALKLATKFGLLHELLTTTKHKGRFLFFFVLCSGDYFYEV